MYPDDVVHAPKKLLASVPLLFTLMPNPVSAQAWNHELVLHHTDITSGDRTGETGNTALSWRYWLNEQTDIDDVPLAETTFVSRSSHVGLGFTTQDTETLRWRVPTNLNPPTITPSPPVLGISPPRFSSTSIASVNYPGHSEQTAFLSGEYVHQENGFTLGASYGRGQARHLADGDSDHLRLWAGKYLGRSTRLSFSYRRDETDYDTREVDNCPGLPPGITGIGSFLCYDYTETRLVKGRSYAVEFRHLGNLGPADFAIDLLYRDAETETRYILTGNAPFSGLGSLVDSRQAGAGFTLYPTRSLSVSLEYMMNDAGQNGGDSDYYALGTEYFLTHRFVVSATVANLRSDFSSLVGLPLGIPSVENREHYSLGVKARF